MLVVGSVVGGGIFFLSSSVAQLVDSRAACLGVWALGGAFALAGALCNGELGAMFPRGGGEYVYLSRTYGSTVGFLSGWTSFWIGFPGSIASLAAAFGRGTVRLFGAPQAAENLVGIGAVITLTLINARGLRPGKWIQNLSSVAKLVAFGAALVLGLAFHGGTATAAAPSGPVRGSSIALALVPIYFAYSGWNAATYVAGEMRDARRDLGRALAIGTLTCVALYVAINIAFLGVLGLAEMRSSPNVAGAAALRVFGPRADAFVTALVVLAVLSSLQAAVVVGPRIYHAMAEDDLFPARLARLHPRTRVPVDALIAQGAISCVLLASGTFERLVTFTTFALSLFSTVCVAAVFVLRWRVPDVVRPFRTPGYPVTPALFVLGNGWVLYNLLASGAGEAIIGICIVLSGVPFYLYFRRSRRQPSV